MYWLSSVFLVSFCVIVSKQAANHSCVCNAVALFSQGRIEGAWFPPLHWGADKHLAFVAPHSGPQLIVRSLSVIEWIHPSSREFIVLQICCQAWTFLPGVWQSLMGFFLEVGWYVWFFYQYLDILIQTYFNEKYALFVYIRVCLYKEIGVMC